MNAFPKTPLSLLRSLYIVTVVPGNNGEEKGGKGPPKKHYPHLYPPLGAHIPLTSGKIGASNGQPVCSNVANICGMALYPLEVGSATRRASLIHLIEDGPYDVLVLYFFAVGCQPILPLPPGRPFIHAFNRILAVAVNTDMLFQRRNLQGALHSHEFRSLVRLWLAR
ncbi:hypothetical protein J3F84DRAFT_221272 [Trichoderma pleuroticola]